MKQGDEGCLVYVLSVFLFNCPSSPGQPLLLQGIKLFACNKVPYSQSDIYFGGFWS